MNISPEYLILLLLAVSLSFYTLFIFFYFRVKAVFILLATFLCIVSLAVIVEICGQIYGYLHPSYVNLVLIPDSLTGWKFLPNSEHIHTQQHWYAREFSSQVKINSQGFRDFERKKQKKQNTVRIALLGDSMIAAREVDFNKTAGQLLEKKLNKEFNESTGKTFEVLNFGVPGYGLDQIYLTWIKVANRFKPDYVFVNVFDKSYFRSISNTWCQQGMFGLYDLEDLDCLYIRPLATIKKELPGNLHKEEFDDFILDYLYINKTVLESIKSFVRNKKSSEAISVLEGLPLSIYPPSDYEKFVEKQNLYIKKKMEGQRSGKIPAGLMLADIFNFVYDKINSPAKSGKLRHDPNEEKMFIGDDKNFPSWLTTNLVNLKIFQVLGNSAAQSGSRFIIMDSFQFFSDFTRYMSFSSIWLEKLSRFYGFNYIPLYKSLNESRNKEIRVMWEHDPHLNEKGNKIFANVMFDFLQEEFAN